MPDASAWKHEVNRALRDFAWETAYLSPKIYADIVYVCIDGSCRNDHLLTSDNFRTRADNHPLSYAVHHIRVSSLSDANNDTVFDTDVGFVDS